MGTPKTALLSDSSMCCQSPIKMQNHRCRRHHPLSHFKHVVSTVSSPTISSQAGRSLFILLKKLVIIWILGSSFFFSFLALIYVRFAAWQGHLLQFKKVLKVFRKCCCKRWTFPDDVSTDFSIKNIPLDFLMFARQNTFYFLLVFNIKHFIKATLMTLLKWTWLLLASIAPRPPLREWSPPSLLLNWADNVFCVEFTACCSNPTWSKIHSTQFFMNQCVTSVFFIECIFTVAGSNWCTFISLL